MKKIKCKTCDAMILPTTADNTGGFCMPCKNGIRNSIEESKEYYARERELDKTCPFRALWSDLVDRVYKTDTGFDSLTDSEKLYYAVSVLSGEVYNGGFVQYFDNSSGEHYLIAEKGLKTLNATNSLNFLQQAKRASFGNKPVPVDRAERYQIIRNAGADDVLNNLDNEFYKDLDGLDSKLEEFAVKMKLVESA